MSGSVRESVRPRLWIVAGPNGSGKSSADDRSDVDEFGGSVWIINPDLLTARIQDAERLPSREANLQSVCRIESWSEASLDVHQTIGVETVLSTDEHRRLVENAKDRGFEVRLIYVFLRSFASCPGSWRRPIRRGCSTMPARSPSCWAERTAACCAWAKACPTSCSAGSPAPPDVCASADRR